ncbi:MipA/OmpV family protein [Catenovulum sp. 2E275]|uniref:MipA/OmpV family protein n=1 Tax=Catenovulum sp. 2E275 TaxID=2980497 RepID=UPI0021D0A70C|nr:MipA/OmpV family protein [Catenovulum sp. 2E275]MCU4677437.1 MipA/OmpV family protein [Catenovulum sp. 2E275]
MRHFSKFLLLSFSLIQLPAIAESAQKPNMQPQGLTYGLGLAVKREIYKGYDQRFIPLPVIGYHGEKLSVFGPFISYKLYQNQQWTFSGLISPRFEGFDESDSAYFKDMDDREFSMDAGVGLDYKQASWGVSSKIRTDILGRSNGNEANLNLTKSYRLGKFTLEPGLGLTYLDENNVDYYYGVRAHEATADRPFYQASSAVNKNVTFTASTPMFDGFIRTSVSNTWYDDSITDSPLTDRDSSLGIMFTYSTFFK